MFEKVKEVIGVRESFDKLVENEMTNGLTQLYFRLRSCPVEHKRSLLDRMDEYVRLSQSKKTMNTHAFDELETTLKFDIYRLIEGDFYDDIQSSLAIPTEALKTYKSLPNEKRALFRKSVIGVPHKRKNLSPNLRQRTRGL